MSKFSNFKIKWPKSREKLENGGRLGSPSAKTWPPKNGPLDPPLRRTPIAVSHGYSRDTRPVCRSGHGFMCPETGLILQHKKVLRIDMIR